MAEWGVFKIGDTVSIWSAFGRTVEKLATVTKMGARKMVLSDGSEWRADGRYPYGQSYGYTHKSVLHRSHGDELNHLRWLASSALRDINCARLSEADLRTLLEIAKRAKDAAVVAAASSAGEMEADASGT